MRSSIDLAPVLNVVELCDDLPGSTKIDVSNLKLRVLHDTMRRFLNPLSTEV